MRYYATKRPIMVGTVPKGFTFFKNFDRKEYVEAVGREAWGYVDYDNEIDFDNWDLIPEYARRNHLILKRLKDGMVLITGYDFPEIEIEKTEALKIIKDNNYTYEWEEQ